MTEIKLPNTLQLKRITLSISQIAPLIGMDNYNNFPRIFCEIWRKYNPNEFREFEIRMKDEGVRQLANANEMNDLWEIDDLLGTNIIQQVKELNSNKDKTSSQMVKIQEDIAKYIKQQVNLNAVQKEELAKKVCSITNKNHGVNNENAILAEFCRLSDKVLEQEQGWVEIPLLSDESLEWVIIGKYDGITTEGELVEAKMRQKCLFKKMRDYENVQVQLYLHGLGFQQGYLVESFTNKKKEMQLYTHEIRYNEEYVSEIILERLKQFTKFFEMVMLDEQKKTDILKGDTKREIYKQYESEYLGIESIEF
jgi:hypothetical protein